MQLDRRQLALPVLALALLGVVPAFAGADEDEVTKKVEAFRAAQAAGNADGIAPLCAEELSYSHSSGSIDDKAKLLAGVKNANYKWTTLEYKNPDGQRRRPGRHRALQLRRRAGIYRRQEDAAKPRHPDELAEAGQRVEAAVALGDQALTARPLTLCRWAKARLRRAPSMAVATGMVGTRSLSSGAHSRDPLALPTLRTRLD